MRTIGLTGIILLLFLGCVDASLAQDNDGAVIVEVVDMAGQPVKYACITLVPKSGDIVFRKADRRGRVRVGKLRKGNYRVVVKVDGYKAQKKNVAVTKARDTVAFVMQPRIDR